MIHLTFSCPGCQQASAVPLADDATVLTCPRCERQMGIPAGALVDGDVRRCVVCPSTDLFVRKDFPQRLGVALVIVGVVGSSIAWAYTLVFWTFAILFATALVDVALYMIVPDALMCYRCGAMYRGLGRLVDHQGFDLEIHEKHRQQAARLQSHQTARRAEPVEHSSLLP